MQVSLCSGKAQKNFTFFVPASEQIAFYGWKGKGVLCLLSYLFEDDGGYTTRTGLVARICGSVRTFGIAAT